MYKTMAEVKKANKDNGQYYFSKDTMKFFNSRIESELYKNKYFISSEKNGSLPRLYTIRKVAINASIESVSEFQEFKTLENARAYIKTLI